LGYETRDVHMEPAPNEHYTKLFVFQERTGPKATRGPYVWGKNGPLFAAITRLRLFLDEIDFVGNLKGREVIWLLPPDPTARRKTVAWALGGPGDKFIFLANFDTEGPACEVMIPTLLDASPDTAMELVFSTSPHVKETGHRLVRDGDHNVADRLLAGEGRVYRATHG